MTREEDSYRFSHADPAKGMQYDAHYREDPWTAFLWRREQIVLDEILSGASGIRCALDFACGTGRITSFLAERVDDVTGVDVSESMLSQARTRVPSASLLRVDLTSGDHPLMSRRFDLITSFRFFVNAEDSLRRAAMSALSGLLAPGGTIVFNNHHHIGSPYIRTVRAAELARGRPYRSMSRAEMEELAESAGLRIDSIHSVGVVHIPKVRLSVATLDRLEESLRHRRAGRLAEDLIAVCSKADR